MRRRSEEDADALRVFYVAAREFAKLGLPALAPAVLAYLGSQSEGSARFADVRDECGLSQSQTTRLTWALMEAGLIDASAPRDDRRMTVFRLTTKGRSVIERIFTQAAQPHR